MKRTQHPVRVTSITPVIFVFLSFWALGFGNCAPTSLTQICESRLPQLDRDLGGAIIALNPWIEAERGIASSTYAPSAEDMRDARDSMDRSDRVSWQHWAEARLTETQAYIDVASGPSRQLLTDIANQWVTFHGYATRGHARKMVATLERIRKQADSMDRAICGGGGATPL